MGLTRILFILTVLVGLSAVPDSVRAEVFTEFSQHNDSEWYIEGDWKGLDHSYCWNGKEAVDIANGFLKTSVLKRRRFGQEFVCGNYQSRQKLHYGYFETRMKSVDMPGVVSHFFTYTGPYYGDEWDEIDFEFIGKHPTQVELNWWRKGNSDGNKKVVDLGFRPSDGFNVYAFLWEPNSIEWFVNGKSVHKVTGDSLPKHPQKLWVGIQAYKLEDWVGKFPGPYKVTAEYDYVKYIPLAQFDRSMITQGSSEFGGSESSGYFLTSEPRSLRSLDARKPWPFRVLGGSCATGSDHCRP